MRTLKKLTAVALFLVLIFTMNINTTDVFAATKNLAITPVGATSFEVGEKDVVVSFRIKNNESSRVEIDSASLKFEKQGFTVKGGMSGSLSIEAGQEANLTFYVSVSDSFNYSTVTATLELKKGLELVFGKGITYDVFSNVESSTGTGGKYVVAVQISHSLDNPEGIKAGESSNISIGVFNRGNTPIKNMDVKLVLPDNIYIDNGSSSSNLGTVSIGARKTTNFSVSAETDIASKTYPITVELTGFDYNNEAVSVKKTIYIPVKSDGGGTSLKNLEILNVSAPSEAETEKDFKVSFQVKNVGSANVKNMKISADVPEGLINKTKSTFIERTINPGESKSYSVTYASKGTEEKTYPIKITVEPVNVEKDAEAETVMQYASVYVKSTGNGSAKTPQLLISDYSYGGTYVQAGTNFRLNLELKNTSGKTITNIKGSLTSDEGTFIPIKSSNSFFIEKIPKKGTESYSMMLNVKGDAKQQTHSMTIDLTYEDGAGNAFTGKDVISVPVVHEARLVVDSPVQPELFAGNPGGVTVQFYNMGKSVLNNLRATAYGDFDTMESINYFVGNMEPGKSDTYDFTIMPRQAGIMSGSIVFTYEDADGEEQIYETPFEFDVMEMSNEVMDPGMMPPEEAKGIKQYLPFIIGGLVVLATAVIVVVKKIRRRKKHREMEIDE